MKKSIIEEIYLDNQGLSEKVELSERYNQLNNQSYAYYEQLLKTLNKEEKEIFNEFSEAEIGVRLEAELMHFKKGFKTGLLLAIECLM